MYIIIISNNLNTGTGGNGVNHRLSRHRVRESSKESRLETRLCPHGHGVVGGKSMLRGDAVSSWSDDVQCRSEAGETKLITEHQTYISYTLHFTKAFCSAICVTKH